MNGRDMQPIGVHNSPLDRGVDEFRYPGPRPLGRGDSQLLVGREKDVARLVYQIYNYSVVEVTAPSGTGKSSLLAAGVIPVLETYGFTIVTLRSWAEVRGVLPADYYYNALKRAFVDTKVAEDLTLWPQDSEEGLAWVAERLGGSLIVIFDQLEELMRVDEHQAQEFLEQVVRFARESSIRQVLSLRSEFKSQLNAVESELAITQWQWYRLEEIDEGFLPDVIHAPRRGDFADRLGAEQQPWPIAEDIVSTIVAAWKGAKAHTASLGLLHLQAALWVLEEQIGDSSVPWTVEAAAGSGLFLALTRAGIDVEQGDVDDDLRLAAERAKAKKQAEAVSSALLTFIALSLGHMERSLNKNAEAESSSTPIGFKGKPRRSRPGTETRFAVARFVDDLSSGGYKIPQSVDDLFLKCYEGLQDLRADRAQLSKLRRIWEKEEVIGSQDSGVLLRVAEEHLAEWRPSDPAKPPLALRDRFFSGRLWKHPSTRESHRGLSGLDALEGLCSLEVVYQRALSWLVDRGIVRITPDARGVRLVTLIHDGFGDALRLWADETSQEPDFFLSALVGENGTSVLSGAKVSGYNDKADEEYDNSAWALQFSGCSIDDAHFVDVVFDTCDLRGTIFFQCVFENVTFRNCYMPGALFLEPLVTGQQGLVFTDSITRTIAVMGGSAEGDAPLVFDGVEAPEEGALASDQSPGVDGLFLERYNGTWRITNCDFRHLSVLSCGTGTIRNSSLRLIHVEDLPAPVDVHASSLHFVDAGNTPDGGETLLQPRARK